MNKQQNWQKDADQVINGYFKEISKIEDFTWELKLDKNKSIWSTSEIATNAMKEKWKTVFVSKKQEIFQAMKPELLESLQLFSVDDLTSAKIDEIVNAIIKVK